MRLNTVRIMSGGALSEKRFKLLLDLLNNRWAHFFWGYFSVSICPQINGANQPVHFVIAQHNIAGRNAVSQLHRRAWTDKCRRRKRLVQHISQRNMQGRCIFASGQLNGTFAPLKIFRRPPNAVHLVKRRVCAMARRRQGPVFPIRKNPRACADQGNSATPVRMCQSRKSSVELARQPSQTGFPCAPARNYCSPAKTRNLPWIVHIHWPHQCARPSSWNHQRRVCAPYPFRRSASTHSQSEYRGCRGAGSKYPDNPFATGQGTLKLTRHGIRRAVWGWAPLPRMTTFSRIPRANPSPQRLFAHAAAVNMRGVEACAALLKKRIGHRCHGRRINLVVRAQHQPRHGLSSPFNCNTGMAP